MKTVFWIVLIIFLFSQCKERPKCADVASALYANANGKLFVTNRIDGKIREMMDCGTDTLTGGNYHFDSLERLTEYFYFVTKDEYSFHEIYNREGEILKTKGEPLVKFRVKEFHEDSVFMSFSFYSLHRSFSSIVLKIDAKPEKILFLKDDSIFSYLKSCRFGFRPNRGKTSLHLVANYFVCNSDTLHKSIKDFSITRDSVINASF